MKTKTKNLQPSRRKAYTPTEAEKTKVLAAMSGIDNVDGFGFYEAIVADTRLDRHRDILTKGFLEIMAKKYHKGRAVVDSHSETRAVGYTFGASVAVDPDDTTHYQLNVKFYVSPDAILFSGANAKTALDQGLVRRVSSSFMAKERKYVSSDAVENTHGVGHCIWDVPIESSVDNIEVLEMSLVVMGVQAGAVIKELGKDPMDEIDTLHKNKKKTMKYTIKSLGKEVDCDQATIDIVELVESKLTATEEILKGYRDAEKSEKDKLIKELVILRCKQFKSLDADKETEKFQGFSLDSLNVEISISKSLVKKAVQLDPSAGSIEDTQLPSQLPSFMD